MLLNPQAWLDAGGDGALLSLFRDIGTVAPFSDGDGRVLATLHPDRPHIGCVSDWVGDVSLLRAAETWLADQGCTVARGPLQMCRWFDYRAVLGPFDEPPFRFEPTERADRWLEAGYNEIQHFVSVVADRNATLAAGVDKAAGLSARGYTLVPVPTDAAGNVPAEGLAEAFRVVHRLFRAAFQDQEGYADVPPDALVAYYARHRTRFDPRLTLLALDPNGEPVGMVIAVPDHGDRPNTFVVLTLAVLPEHRRHGVASWMLAAVHQAARKAGYQRGIHAFVRARAEDGGFARGQLIRRYALFERDLSA